jgi:glycosyltransferase involved in cell wall biosynthesis
MNIPRVSVVMAVHNGAASQASSLGSLQRQSLSDIEIVVVDDHSSDSTPEILEELARRDSRIRLIRLPHNQGVQAARAAGLLQVRAPWVAFLDADDRALPLMLERLLSAAETSTSDIAICGSLRITLEGNSLGPKVRFLRQQVFEEEIFESFCRLKFGTCAVWNKLYRTDLVRNWGTRPHLWSQNGTEDTLVNIGCFWEARRVVTIPELLHHYVLQPGSLTSDLHAEHGFSKIVRAFAIAVELYAHLGPQALAGITDLYRAQLAYPSYALPFQATLPVWPELLGEPLEFLAQEHPQALAMLLARLPCPTESGLRARCLRLFGKLIAWRHG